MKIHPYPGFYLVFEGIEGAGKDTQIRMLAEAGEGLFGRKVVVTMEPGGTPLAQEIRDMLLRPDGGPMGLLTEAYLFAASRAEALRRTVIPALRRGEVVLSNRSFYASLAYQGFGRKLGWELVWKINEPAIGGMLPDLVVWPDLPVEEGLRRVRVGRTDKIDRLDQQAREFYERVREGYCFFAEREPERFLVVDGTLSIEAQAEIIRERVLTGFRDWELSREVTVRREGEG